MAVFSDRKTSFWLLLGNQTNLLLLLLLPQQRHEKGVSKTFPKRSHWRLRPRLKSLITFKPGTLFGFPCPIDSQSSAMALFWLWSCELFLLRAMCCCAVANGDSDRSGTLCTRLERVCAWEQSKCLQKEKKCLGFPGIFGNIIKIE